ncbi:flavo protein [Pseudomassariella vexata]|uniref:Flavo protein n=1 Tax=Pseudomassariella vexata TaxID=1141098 RepID=A0A1Y2EC03_9PEZI|nr:flavo protein [Pseudomassariella vexata]ORY68947.1 flavo protein [Pseudomassariella vexata]
MLQAVSSAHDDHHIRSNSSSIASITRSLHDSRTHLLLASSGSVATIKLPLIIQALSSHPNLSIRVLLTPSASRFLAGQSAEQPTISTLHRMSNVDGVYIDEDEWKEPWKRGNAILHIELRRWADLLVIAPLSANTMAKIVGGMADGILTSVVRAWDARGELDSDTKRIIVAPAMNTAMWRHPVTAKQIRVLDEEWGIGKNGKGEGWFEVLRPQQKTLACGDVGDGAMMEWKEIVSVIEERLGLT